MTHTENETAIYTIRFEAPKNAIDIEAMVTIHQGRNKGMGTRTASSSPGKRRPYPLQSEYVATKQSLRSRSPEAHRLNRASELTAIFQMFDRDGSGAIGGEELMRLGKNRQKLGHKSRAWTEERNRQMIEKMESGGDGDGQIDESEFVSYFLKSLQRNTNKEFMETMEEFRLCAEMAMEEDEFPEEFEDVDVGIRVIPPTASEEDETEEPTTDELEAMPGHSHGNITPRVREMDEDGEPTAISGWLWKKAGGETGISMSHLIGRNWKRRWFTLKKGTLSYYEGYENGHASNDDNVHVWTEGEGTPLWEGNLKTALMTPNGTLKCVESHQQGPGKRIVLDVHFEKRTLVIGTAPGGFNQSDLEIIAFWKETLIKHHLWAAQNLTD